MKRGRKKKEGTVVVSVRMPEKLYNFFKKKSEGKQITTNAVITACLEACACLYSDKIDDRIIVNEDS